jgi:formyltetrahydrofolate synthetase
MCLVGITDSGRDITVAKFQEEKDRREISMASYRIWTGVNAQIDPKVIMQISVEKKADKVYLVTSKEPLPQGEFILFTIIPDVAAMTKANTPSSLGGYDFGHHEQ